MNEAKIEKEFRKYKSQYIRLLGNHALSNDELDDVCKSLFGSKYRGSHPVDSKFQMKPGMFIFNTDIASGPGVHWVSLVLTKKTAYIYDSFGRDPEKTIPILYNRLRRAKYKIKFDTKDKEQRATYKNRMVVNCGHACISFLLCVHKFGIRAAMKI
jgi:hypothetical protein